jgi:hypothetical protein
MVLGVLSNKGRMRSGCPARPTAIHWD